MALSIHRWSDRTFVDVNAAFTSLLGWARDDLVGRTTVEMNITDAAGAALIRSQLTSAGTVRDAELTVRTRFGELRRVLMSTEVIELRGEPHAITTFVDITARKEAELVSQRLAAIVESSDDVIIGKDLHSTITSWNRGAEKVFGYSASEMVGASIMRLIPPDRQAEEIHILDRIKRGESVEHFETLRLTKDGRLINVSVTASPIKDAGGVPIGVSKVARDITDRTRAYAAQAASEARYRALFAYAPDGIVIADSLSYYIDANAAACRMLGYTRDELIGLHASDIVAGAEVPHIEIALSEVHAKADHHREWNMRRKDGTVFVAEVMATMMPDGNLLGVIRDITERKSTDARFRRLVDSNVQGVMFWNNHGEISGANDEFLRIVGYTREDLRAGAMRWAAMTPPEYAERDRLGMAEIAANGISVPREKEYFRKDGSRVPILIGGAAFEDSLDEGVCFVLDLTERKQLEQQFLRAQRMESIGTLAGGIAHDLNNVLTPILLSVEILRDLVKDADDVAILDMLQRSARHGADLVKQVLSFARGVEGERVTVNPLHVINELLAVVRDTFPRSIHVRFAPARNVWNITGDPTQMHQVFLNLCVNARDAMPQGGTLSLTMDNVVLDETYAAMHADARPGQYVMVTVTDTGTGVPPEIRDRLFEPFFTTKGVGKGTGLGLSTTMAIVKSHGGSIHLYSEAGRGATFKVYLPASISAAAANEVTTDVAQLPRGHGELVLVVDDEQAIRTVVQSTLEHFGYRVLLAINGAVAVGLYAQYRAEIALVLTDMAMPVMDGPATIVALKAMNPEVKIVGSSGVTSGGSVGDAVDAGVRHFVPKPYTAETLLRTLHLVLRGTADN